MSCPHIRSIAHCFQRPARRNLSASTTRRAAAINNVNAKSAVVSVKTSGVLLTAIWRAVAASVSMLSKPTATFEIALRFGSLSITSAVNLSVRWLTAASLPAIRASSPSGARLSSDSLYSMSTRSRRYSTASGYTRFVTRTLGLMGATLSHRGSMVSKALGRETNQRWSQKPALRS